MRGMNIRRTGGASPAAPAASPAEPAPAEPAPATSPAEPAPEPAAEPVAPAASCTATITGRSFFAGSSFELHAASIATTTPAPRASHLDRIVAMRRIYTRAAPG